MNDSVDAGNAGIGRVIRQARQSARMSTAELARRVHRSESHLRSLENGHRSLPEDLALAIAEVLDVDAATLLRAPRKDSR